MAENISDHDRLIRLDEKVDHLIEEVKKVCGVVEDYPLTKNKLKQHLDNHKAQQRRQLTYLSALAGSISTLLYIVFRLASGS